MTFALTDELRAQLRSELLAFGAEGNDALLVMDLAVHALNQAQEALGRVSGSAPPHLRIATIAVACSLLHNVTAPKVPEDGNYRATPQEMDDLLREQDKWAERGRGTWHPGDEIE